MADAHDRDDFGFTELLPLGADDTPYRLITTEGVSTFETPEGTFLKVEPEAIRQLTAEAMREIAHFLRPAHLQQLRNILDDPEASANDRFVATDLLKNAAISAGGVLPMCQDTGTAIVKAKKGQYVFTGGGDERAIAQGIQDTYLTSNLRYSQMAPLTMYDEKNTGTNLPGEIKISAIDGDAYKFLFLAKGGGSANKSYLFQETKALLNEATLLPWVFDKMQMLGTAACPPYHLAVVIGGTSAEFAVETAKLASTKYLDSLPTEGSELGHGFRDIELEAKLLELAQTTGIGAQFGGKYFCHDVRVVRLPRHGASCPDRDGGLVLGRPPGTRQDHPRRCVPGTARTRSRPIPAGDDRDRPRGRRRRADRSQPADGRHPRRAVELPGANPRDADRPDRGRPRHRPRQDQGASRCGRADAPVPPRSLHLLRRTRQDPRGLRLRIVRADHGGSDGLATSSSSRPPAGR